MQYVQHVQAGGEAHMGAAPLAETLQRAREILVEDAGDAPAGARSRRPRLTRSLLRTPRRTLSRRERRASFFARA